MSKWNLDIYRDFKQPSIFFGVYYPFDYQLIISHKSLAVVVWGGSDSMASTDTLKTLNLPHIKHISGSKWITDDLKRAGIKPIYIPISCVDSDKTKLKALPLGKKIYIYTAGEGFNADFYGKQIYDKLIAEYGADMFYVVNAKSYTREQLYNEVMPNCFIGLRLVKHDGLSETISELGLMGRRVVYNGCEPNALNYNSYEDIKAHIDHEMKYIGETFQDVSDKMKKHLEVGNDWLNSDFYNNK